MKNRAGLAFRHRACGRCGGDAYIDPREDEAEWRCMLCARPVPELAPRNRAATPQRCAA